MRFFLDHCVPAGVARVLTEAGHEVIIQKDAIAADSPDPIVALASVENDAILVTFDKDHKALANRFGVSDARLKTLSRVYFRCAYPEAEKRLLVAMTFIAREWEECHKDADPRMFIEVLGYGLKTLR
jgi:hypothetical protein